MQNIAIELVVQHYNANSSFPITKQDVFVVWFCKTLQNWKVLLATTKRDGLYFEVTYNGDEKEAYLDVYKKLENYRIPDEGE